MPICYIPVIELSTDINRYHVIGHDADDGVQKSLKLTRRGVDRAKAHALVDRFFDEFDALK